MSHSISSHIGAQVTIVGTGTALAAQPIPSGKASTGVANNQAASLASNTAVAASTTTTISVAPATPWTVNAYLGHIVQITSGTLIGQTRLITGNTNQALTVEPAFSVDPDGMTFIIMSPSTAVPVVQGWVVDQTAAVAGVLRLQSKGLLGGVMTTRNLLLYTTTAAGTDRVTGGHFIGIPGGDLRVVTAVAHAGSVTPDAYWINDSIVGVIDQ